MFTVSCQRQELLSNWWSVDRCLSCAVCTKTLISWPSARPMTRGVDWDWHRGCQTWKIGCSSGWSWSSWGRKNSLTPHPSCSSSVSCPCISSTSGTRRLHKAINARRYCNCNRITDEIGFTAIAPGNVNQSASTELSYWLQSHAPKVHPSGTLRQCQWSH